MALALLVSTAILVNDGIVTSYFVPSAAVERRRSRRRGRVASRTADGASAAPARRPFLRWRSLGLSRGRRTADVNATAPVPEEVETVEQVAGSVVNSPRLAAASEIHGTPLGIGPTSPDITSTTGPIELPEFESLPESVFAGDLYGPDETDVEEEDDDDILPLGFFGEEDDDEIDDVDDDDEEDEDEDDLVEAINSLSPRLAPTLFLEREDEEDIDEAEFTELITEEQLDDDPAILEDQLDTDRELHSQMDNPSNLQLPLSSRGRSSSDLPEFSTPLLRSRRSNSSILFISVLRTHGGSAEEV
ncbi:hypothetical protein HK101_005111 [Irineochytrium annulatum]|nr:hypothetical protein HK101_005111 [Irineochytrium annulatum]